VEQKYSSANTSINKHRLPAIYNKVKFQPGSIVLDYGCGKYTDHIEQKVKEQNCIYWPYDPYNPPKTVNRLPYYKVDYAICSNVLNVIDNIEVIKNIISTLIQKAKHIAISVYEGNGSGIGKVTGKDTYQRNEKINWYVNLIESMGIKCKIKNKIIIINE
jgi:hypothetical protein